ncbi:tumor susceptibility protein [Cricetulus griseus]|uniref:Tumor susceptibility protein n=1 Tax=Cricetulus griseus TaxID=10029 RepID=A0A061IA89_CRIGR|nr:tumor susceptibility protein [Cricetulus griseus]
MEFDCEGVRRLLGKYKFRDLTVEELKNVNMYFPHFRYSMDTYVFKDTSQKDLLNFTGTIPVMYQGNTYNIPIRFWILDSHPFAPPICFLKPTANMEISVGKHVDAKGRIYLPYLQNWSHPKSVIVGLIKEMIAKFQEELPLYSVPSSNEAQQVDLLAYIAKITEESEFLIVDKTKYLCLEFFIRIFVNVEGIADKLLLLDLSDGTNQGTMDLDIFNLPNVEISKDLSASAHSKVVIFTANSLGGFESYLHAVQSNVDMFRTLVPALGHYNQHAVFLVASQPVVFVVRQAMELLRVKGQRSWSVGLSVADLVDTIVNNKKKVHSVSTLAKGYYGLDNEVFLSLPCILGTSGVSEVKTTAGEDPMTETLQNSGSSIHNLQQQLKLDFLEKIPIGHLFKRGKLKYKYRDLTVRQTVNVIAMYKDLKPVLDSYVFNDGSSRELVNLTGTIPVRYRGNTYNIPICLWLLDTYPYNPPICFVKPTSSMTIKTGKHVDANGKIYLPYLHDWKHPRSELLELIQIMIVIFGEEPPVFSRPTISASYPPYTATGPPNTSYMPGMPSGISAYPSGYPPNPSAYPGCPYPPAGPYPATTSSQYPSQPPVTTVGPSRDGTISEDTIRASLISAVSDKLRWRMKEEMDGAQAELNALKRTEEDLKKGHQKLEEMVTRLDQEVAEVDKNIELLKKKDEELSSALEKMENQSENNDIDEVIIPTAPLYKQILNLYAEENAIEDTIFYLGEALRRGVIDLDVFLKHVRLLSRKQFQLRALMQKARKTAGLSDLY